MRFLWHCVVAVAALWAACPPAVAEPVDFGRDVLPLLSDRCFSCHGPDASAREADLRLDRQADALAPRGEGAAVVPRHPELSAVIARITALDEDRRMPPPDSHVRPLTAHEIALLRQWIEAGAPWKRHWSLARPQRPDVPFADMHPIDAFVRQQHLAHGLHAADRAPAHTLLRRLSFDLTGLPPTTADVERFISKDGQLSATEAIRYLVSSQHHAERMAMWWLDAARYADTDGYQGDATRTNWPWRDWVIEAFRDNLPFDQFTIEQFAGDLLPNASDGQRLATCFHRNHMTNGEGGRDPEESRIDYVIDRVNTTSTVWLGLTVGCAQCHAHKFDPITQEDYYRLFAFFNQVDEDGRAGADAKPYFKYQSPYAARAVNELQRLVDQYKQRDAEAKELAESDFAVWLQRRIEEVGSGFQAWHRLSPTELTTAEGTVLMAEASGVVQASGPNPRQDDYRIVARPPLARISAVRLEVLPHESHTDGKFSRGADGDFILTNFKVQLQKPDRAQLLDLEFDSAIADVEKKVSGRDYGNIRDTLDDDPRNGWTTADEASPTTHVGVFALAEPLELSGQDELIVVLFHRSTRGDANVGRFRLSVTDQLGAAVRSLEPMPMEALAAAHVSEVRDIDADLRQRLLEQFLVGHAGYQSANTALRRAERQLEEAKRASEQLNVMVLAERSPARDTYVLERGVWDQHGELVHPGVPPAIGGETGQALRTRLDFARWLVSRSNPLTARVLVNHLWGQLFGAGLVRTPEDFGVQGDRPTHPELLDWLAVELMDCGWDLRHIIQLIVTSETYQQSSVATADLLQRDPENLWLARAGRYRLPSWMIRDAVLRTSGLLNPALGGPPVRPYQPDGVWAEIFMGRFRYEPSEGPAQFRRTIYAFWRRSSAPTFLFDAAQRRVCEVRTRRTNTPLQALTLLNDRTQLVAAAALAFQVGSQAQTRAWQVSELYRRVLSRPPLPQELALVLKRWQTTVDYYVSSPDQATLLLEGHGAARGDLREPSELAAAMVTASMLFNLDEAITRE